MAFTWGKKQVEETWGFLTQPCFLSELPFLISQDIAGKESQAHTAATGRVHTTKCPQQHRLHPQTEIKPSSPKPLLDVGYLVTVAEVSTTPQIANAVAFLKVGRVVDKREEVAHRNSSQAAGMPSSRERPLP